MIRTPFGGRGAAQEAVNDHEGRISRLVLMGAIGPAVPGQHLTMPTGPPAPASASRAGTTGP
ncbi:hypothetical protein [Streptomyces liangshanensis]|uniref:hypothetical protein n=1 Tax=Streptomyces liangshanensis TaxID=2717324 RepID=UPI0036DA333D